MPFSSPGDLPDPEIEPGSPVLQADSLPKKLQGNSKDLTENPLGNTNLAWGFPGGASGKKNSLASPGNTSGAGLILRPGRFSGKEMVPHSSILAWEIPWIEEPSGLQSMRSQRVRYN